MKNFLIACTAAFILGSSALVAAPGDTTVVTVFNLQQLTHYGAYDTVATFPTGKRYRKIRLHYILGRYACSAGSQYCGSWDYTTSFIARPAGKDTAEIARIITPYATDWLAQNKKHEYIVDVTDYATVLEGTTSMRFRYEGYSWGFTVTLKLEFIEGTPIMDALSVSKIYDGYYTYGSTSDPIENHLTPQTFSYTAPAAKIYVKNTVSGHGSDAQGCSEFCSKYYRLKIDGAQFAQHQLWRSDCGINEVYPQTGTWIYERGNWCPGAVVEPVYHDISDAVTAGTTFSVDADMQAYTASSPSGGYNWVSQLIKYSAPNHARDVSIEDIIAPTKHEMYFRENPNCVNPTIRVRGNGTDSINEIVFSYGFTGHLDDTMKTYTWNGSLGFNQYQDIVFPNSSAMFRNTPSTVFQVSVVAVNGLGPDEDLLNNTYTSERLPSQLVPPDFVIRTKTNSSGGSINETSWVLTDEDGNIVAARTGMANNITVSDTISNLAYGCYKLSVDDSDCDGMSWWANGDGTGYVRLMKTGTSTVIYTVQPDFGCNNTVYLSVQDPNPNFVGLTDLSRGATIDLFPNPASTSAELAYDLNGNTGTVMISDLNGRQLLSRALTSTAGYENVDLNGFANGVYIVTIRENTGAVTCRKLVVSR